MPRHPFSAVNLISDPIHGYVELTKRLTTARVRGRRAAGRGRRRGGPARHGVAPAAAPDQPAPERPLGLPDRRALAVHPRPRGHARGRAVGAVALPVAAGGRSSARGEPRPVARASSSRRCGSPGCSTTSATGRSPTSSTTTSWPASRPRRTPRRPAGKRLTHEDLSQLIIERELGPTDRGAAPGAGRRAGARRVRRRRADRPALGLVPRLEAGPGRRRRCRAGSAGSSRSCRACSRSTTSTTSGATPT